MASVNLETFESSPAHVDKQITCPLTGKSWLGSYRHMLKTCVRCMGLIDVWRESWMDGPMHGKCPEVKSEPAQV